MSKMIKRRIACFLCLCCAITACMGVGCAQGADALSNDALAGWHKTCEACGRVIAAYEELIAQGKLRSVDSLRLGYAAWDGKDGGYVLTPVWVLEGEIFASATADYKVRPTQNSDKPLEYGYVLVDARTGELIDPFDTGADRSCAN